MRGASGFVYVNQDGSVRELSPDEYDLSQEFHPGDGGRPYIKTSYEGERWLGSVSGFLPRDLVPSGALVVAVKGRYSRSEC
jgi:hypothetical protein